MATLAVCSASFNIRWLLIALHDTASEAESGRCPGETPFKRALIALATLFKLPVFSILLFDFTWFGSITYFPFFGSLLATLFKLSFDDYVSRLGPPRDDFFWSSLLLLLPWAFEFRSFGYTWYLNAFLFEHFWVYLNTLRSDKSCRALLLAGLCLLIQFFWVFNFDLGRMRSASVCGWFGDRSSASFLNSALSVISSFVMFVSLSLNSCGINFTWFSSLELFCCNFLESKLVFRLDGGCLEFKLPMKQPSYVGSLYSLWNLLGFLFLLSLDTLDLLMDDLSMR